uniref:Uncharacterized protein n=1 Tax=Capra hircus TaxID=9925 RepID=A0A8C2XXJ9_CAPHI
ISSFQLRLNTLKEPLGFIKLLEWNASIFAFANCGGCKGKTEIQGSCTRCNSLLTASFLIILKLSCGRMLYSK